MALTYPGVKNVSPLGGANESSSIWGLLEERNRWSVGAPIVGILVCNVVNLAWAGPVTTKIMKERKHQGGWFSSGVCGECVLMCFWGARDERWEEVL